MSTRRAVSRHAVRLSAPPALDDIAQNAAVAQERRCGATQERQSVGATHVTLPGCGGRGGGGGGSVVDVCNGRAELVAARDCLGERVVVDV